MIIFWFRFMYATYYFRWNFEILLSFSNIEICDKCYRKDLYLNYNWTYPLWLESLYWFPISICKYRIFVSSLWYSGISYFHIQLPVCSTMFSNFKFHLYPSKIFHNFSIIIILILLLKRDTFSSLHLILVNLILS